MSDSYNVAERFTGRLAERIAQGVAAHCDSPQAQEEEKKLPKEREFPSELGNTSTRRPGRSATGSSVVKYLERSKTPLVRSHRVCGRVGAMESVLAGSINRHIRESYSRASLCFFGAICSINLELITQVAIVVALGGVKWARC